jgi:hypothetical protein
MCSPQAVGYAGVGLQAAGQIQDGKEASKAAAYNARIAELVARDAEKRGADEELRYRGRIRQLIGSQRAAIGGANLELSGTPLDILLDTAEIGERDALTIRGNTEREAAGLRSQGAEFLRSGKAAKKRGVVGAAGTLLTGIPQVKSWGY